MIMYTFLYMFKLLVLFFHYFHCNLLKSYVFVIELYEHMI